MTLKRFDFNFETMQRSKVNDYFEFPMELDMSEYTQEQLGNRESYERIKKEKLEEASKGGEGEFNEEDILESIKL